MRHSNSLGSTEDSNVVRSATVPCLLQHSYGSTAIREVARRTPPPPVLPCSVLPFSCTLIPPLFLHSPYFSSLPWKFNLYFSIRSFLPRLEHVILYPIKLRKWKREKVFLLPHFFSEISSSLSCALEGRSSRMFSPVQVSNTMKFCSPHVTSWALV